MDDKKDLWVENGYQLVKEFMTRERFMEVMVWDDWTLMENPKKWYAQVIKMAKSMERTHQRHPELLPKLKDSPSKLLEEMPDEEEILDEFE